MSKLEELRKEYHETFEELYGYHDSQQFSPNWQEWRLEKHIYHMKNRIQEREWYGNPQDVYAVNQHEGLRVW